MPNYFFLKNGSDLRGTALEAENDPVTLTDEALYAIACAFCSWLEEKKGFSRPTIAVGHDSRLTGEHISGILSEAFRSCGCDVIQTGLSSTPSMFMLLQDDFGANASVMITASHLPYQKNGLKFFLKEGGLESSDIDEILILAGNEKKPIVKDFGKEIRCSYLEQYAEGLVRKVRLATSEERPLLGKRIIVDAGGGAGGFYERLVLRPLGADTFGSQFLEPDGMFSHHIPNPENRDAMNAICEAVKKYHADFGIIFDTDVDRAGAVSSSGEEINRNRLIALISAILLEERKDAYIVTDSVTSNGLTSFIKSHGGIHHRFKRGYKNVINESKRLNHEGKYSPLAIETSGHAAFQENYFLDDGAYLITRILIALAKTSKEGKDLISLISDLPEPKESLEIRLPFLPETDFKKLGKEVIFSLQKAAEKLDYLSPAQENYEGVRINFDQMHGDGWALIRLSLHEPIMPVNIESDSEGGCKKIISILYELMRGFDFLDTKKLING